MIALNDKGNWYEWDQPDSQFMKRYLPDRDGVILGMYGSTKSSTSNYCCPQYKVAYSRYSDYCKDTLKKTITIGAKSASLYRNSHLIREATGVYPLYKPNKIATPSQTMYMTEGLCAGGESRYIKAITYGGDAGMYGISFRHNGEAAANVLYCDGHVAAHAVDETTGESAPYRTGNKERGKMAFWLPFGATK